MITNPKEGIMTSLLKKYAHLLAVLTIALQGLIYLLISSLVSRSGIPIAGAVDDRIPYVSWFVISYMAWMLVLYLSFIYLGLTNRSLYWRTILAYNAAVTVSNLIFIAFPTTMPRPDIQGNDIFDRLVLFIYNHDHPVNCFPSIHCLTTYLLFITMIRHKLFSFGRRVLISVFLWSIIASTVFIKQHALVDMIGGIALAEITYRAVHRLMDKRQKAQPPVGTGMPMNG
jgi:membrane-associated phospholipid phosphatase